MTSFYDPTLSEIFYPSKADWSFTNDLESDLSIMRFNNNPYSKFDKLPGFDKLPDFVKNTLSKGSSVYSTSEVEGWNRMEFQNQRLMDMFKSDVIFIPPGDESILFYKALENWFEGLPYGTEEQGQPDSFDMSDELSNHKAYGLTQSLLSIFDK